MTSLRHLTGSFLLCTAGWLLHPSHGLAQTAPPASGTPAQATAHRDGQHDFDFEVGSWKIHLKRLQHPLTGSTTWIEFDGTSVTRKVWEGRAQLEEFETNGPSGRVEGLTLRLYNPESRQWSLYWANGKSGALGLPPTVGEFNDGRGEFYDHEPYNGRMIFVRYSWSQITPNSAHFEQAFSDDGGKTWEVNWITDQTRTGDALTAAH
jgi:hypothetical protein